MSTTPERYLIKPAAHAVIDAEGCCAGDDGRTDFNALHSRVNDHAVFAYAFDLMMIERDRHPARATD
jgi:ATP-dependent DNA ligase